MKDGVKVSSVKAGTNIRITVREEGACFNYIVKSNFLIVEMISHEGNRVFNFILF